MHSYTRSYTVSPVLSALERVQACPKDGLPLELDLEVLRASIAAGWPAIRLWRCLNGHSRREWDVDEVAAWRATRNGRVPCVVCGLWLPRATGGRAQVHQGECLRARERARAAWGKLHPDAPFFVEEQPWYRGLLAPPEAPLPPLDPLAGAVPAEWAEGWLAIYGGEPAVAA